MILTAPFLKEQICKFEPKTPPKGQTTPVVSQFKYDNLEFFVELERLQFIERGISDFKESKAIGCFERYLTILEYTPVFICGINLNATVTEFDPKLIDTILNDKNKIVKLLEADSVMIGSQEVVDKDTAKTWTSYDLKYPAGDNEFLLLGFRKKDDAITINFNYEVKGLDKEKDRLKKLGQNLNKVVAAHIKLAALFIEGK